MSNRITEKDLQNLCDRINEATGSPMTPWERVNDRNRANIGNYHISHAYGGVCLQRMHNESGGVSCPLSQGHGPKRDLYNEMYAFLCGLGAAKQ